MTGRTNWAALAAGTTTIAALAVIVGLSARDDGATIRADALIERLGAAIDAVSVSDPAAIPSESPEALAAATRAALAATAPAQVATDEDFASGWANASGTRYVPDLAPRQGAVKQP